MGVPIWGPSAILSQPFRSSTLDTSEKAVPDLSALEAEFDRRATAMRTETQQRALDTAFSLSGEELGSAALAQAKKDAGGA